MKYKVGDKVKIRKNLVSSRAYNGIYITINRETYFGKIAKIKSIEIEHDSVELYYLDIDNEEYKWTDDMLEPVEEKFTPKDLKTGMFGITNDGEKFVVVNNYLVFQKGTALSIKNLDENLEHIYENIYIESIYDDMLEFNDLNSCYFYHYVYKREKAKRTLSQIKKELGYDFDLIGE